MNERHEHAHKYEAICVEVQLPQPVELHVTHTYQITDGTKAWLGESLNKILYLLASGIALLTIHLVLLMFFLNRSG